MAFCMNFKLLPRCGAKARSNHGLPCRQAAKKGGNGRCHWHGGRPIRHGNYSKTSAFERIQQRSMIDDMRKVTLYFKTLIKETHNND